MVLKILAVPRSWENKFKWVFLCSGKWCTFKLQCGLASELQWSSKVILPLSPPATSPPPQKKKKKFLNFEQNGWKQRYRLQSFWGEGLQHCWGKGDGMNPWPIQIVVIGRRVVLPPITSFFDLFCSGVLRLIKLPHPSGVAFMCARRI